jgi:hypothetical protein
MALTETSHGCAPANDSGEAPSDGVIETPGCAVTEGVGSKLGIGVSAVRISNPPPPNKAITAIDATTARRGELVKRRAACGSRALGPMAGS